MLWFRNTNHGLEQLVLALKAYWHLAGLCGTGQKVANSVASAPQTGLEGLFPGCQDMDCLWTAELCFSLWSAQDMFGSAVIRAGTCLPWCTEFGSEEMIFVPVLDL